MTTYADTVYLRGHQLGSSPVLLTCPLISRERAVRLLPLRNFGTDDVLCIMSSFCRTRQHERTESPVIVVTLFFDSSTLEHVVHRQEWDTADDVVVLAPVPVIENAQARLG